jgi:hypothetical protein
MEHQVTPMTTLRPLDRETVAALRMVGRVLGQDCAYVDGDRFVFPLGDEWALAISPDDAGRFRISACYGLTEVATLWSLAKDPRRLADLARGLRREIVALVA